MSDVSPKFSVAMCTYNGAHYLREQLNSIASQTLLPHELVIADDGSEDSVIEIIEEFKRNAPFPIRFLRNPANLGSTRNFEQVISLCSSEYIALSDQDDIWLPEKLECFAARFAADRSIGGIFSDAKLIDERSQPRGDRLWEVFGFREKEQAEFRANGPVNLLCRGDFVTGATMIFRADLREKILPIPTSWIHDGWLTWGIVLESHLEYIRTPLIQYRVHSSQQAGIPPRTLKERWRNLCTSESEGCARRAERLEDLLLFARKRAHNCSLETLKCIEDAAAFSRFRSRSWPNRFAQSRSVLRNLPSYFKYTGGIRTAIKDVIV